mmetsp:Transcript_39493/g.156809  ORF Transcript_39493/g.156809 Transcript_39493/m.156809 type:complete len:280 (-) Transcript_39493:1684-2523(-)
MDVSTKYVGEDSGPRPDVHERFGWDKMREDLKSLRSGTVPWSVFMALVIGVICGTAAYVYYTALEWLLEVFWVKLPQTLVMDNSIWPENLYWLWIPIVCLTFAGLVGLSIAILGFPGDLAYTVKCVHELGYVDMGHTPSMVAASQFSIIAGASLGPEAPLVAICAAIAGWVSRNLFKHTQKNLIRKHTLCGMACALAAFFGVPLGGSLFALEVFLPQFDSHSTSRSSRDAHEVVRFWADKSSSRIRIRRACNGRGHQRYDLPSCLPRTGPPTDWSNMAN